MWTHENIQHIQNNVNCDIKNKIGGEESERVKCVCNQSEFVVSYK